MELHLYGTDGQVNSLLGTLTDITERKRVETALRESEDRFRSVFENSPVGIAIARNGIYLYVNSAQLRLFCHSDASDLCGTSLLNLIAPEYREEISERIGRREREPVPNAYETMGCRKDGSLFAIYVEVAKIGLPDGAATVAFIIDVTERKRAEMERERLIRELQEALANDVPVMGLCLGAQLLTVASGGTPSPRRTRPGDCDAGSRSAGPAHRPAFRRSRDPRLSATRSL
jgi:PAS domain S-box-containing protein